MMAARSRSIVMLPGTLIVVGCRAAMRDEGPDEPDWPEWGLFVLTAALALTLLIVQAVKFYAAR